MGYTMLKNSADKKKYTRFSLEEAALTFIRENCEGLRFDRNVELKENFEKRIFSGTSLNENEIPYNMQMDIDRLCLENAVDRFLKSGKKEDAFGVYFCYLEMFIGDYEKTRRMIELLSEFEVNGSGLLMKHRDHYSHSVYVFVLGLAIYQSNSIYRAQYDVYYGLTDSHEAAYHYLQYWGLTALFHDIGYPFELPFEQVISYFEVGGDKRENGPFVAYHDLGAFLTLDDAVKESLKRIYPSQEFSTINEVFAYALTNKLGDCYAYTREQMQKDLIEKPTRPDKYNYFMDHAYFSAIILFRKLFGEMGCEVRAEYLDALTAILMHNSLYKFCIAHYKSDNNIPFQAKLHPLAYMLMLCDELQCWDRTSYGRNSKKELHPMGCSFDLSRNAIRATYLFDEKEIGKINRFKDNYIEWLKKCQGKAPGLKAYSGMYLKNDDGISCFQADIERIVDLSSIKLGVETGLAPNMHVKNKSYLSDSNFINLYNFAVVLNGRWNNAEWKKAKMSGQEEEFLADEKVKRNFSDSFKKLSLEYKLSNINQAKAFANYMNEIGCFYTDKAVDFEMVERFETDELVRIGILEHQRWLQEHYDMGWEYGTPAKADRDLLRQHKDLVPDFTAGQTEVSDEQAKANYERLDKAEQDKDTEPMECMLAMLRMFDGLRIYRLK